MPCAAQLRTRDLSARLRWGSRQQEVDRARELREIEWLRKQRAVPVFFLDRVPAVPARKREGDRSYRKGVRHGVSRPLVNGQIENGCIRPARSQKLESAADGTRRAYRLVAEFRDPLLDQHRDQRLVVHYEYSCDVAPPAEFHPWIAWARACR